MGSRVARHGTRRAQRGYTIIELMMSLVVLAIGVSGVISMEKITATANRNAKNLALATHVAQSWQEQLAADASLWNHPSSRNSNSDLDETAWLTLINGVNGTTGWVQPAYNAQRAFGAAFDPLGNPLSDADAGKAAFCAHIRLTWLFADDTPRVGNGLLRTEVRVFWPREGAGGTVDGNALCSGAVPDDVGQAVDQYHFVYLASAVKQNTAI